MNQPFINDFVRGTVHAPVNSRYKYRGEPVAGYLNQSVYVLLDVQPEEVELKEIYTPPNRRGHGWARRSLGALKVLAHKHGLRLSATPLPLAGSSMTQEQLARWFFRQGLRVIGGIHCYINKEVGNANTAQSTTTK